MTTIFNPVLKPQRTFAQDLKRYREERSWNVYKCAKVTGTSEATWHGWESGALTPTARDVARICANFGNMKKWKQWARDLERAQEQPAHMEPVAGEEVSVGKDITMAVLNSTAGPKVIPQEFIDTVFGAEYAHYTFGKALRTERHRTALSQDELAELLKVTQSTVERWEQDAYNPIKAHYDELLSLFPLLARAPRPAIQDIEKPVGSAGTLRDPRPDAAPPAPKPAPPSPTPAPLAPPVVVDAARPPVMLQPLSFGTSLAAARIQAGLERLDLAHKLRVTRRVVRGWELDERVPIPEHLDALFVLFPDLRGYDFEYNGPPPPPVGKLTFGRALRAEREHRGMHRTDLGALLNRSHWTVTVWEQDRYPPSADTYVRLCEIFPALLTSEKPSNHPRPTGETPPMAATSPAPVLAVAPAPQPAPAPPAQSSVGTMIRLLGAVRRVETSGASATVLALLQEASRSGVTVSDLLALLSPEAT